MDQEDHRFDSFEMNHIENVWCEWWATIANGPATKTEEKKKKKHREREKTKHWISIVILCNSNQMIEKTKVSFIAFWIFYIAWHTHSHSFKWVLGKMRCTNGNGIRNGSLNTKSWCLIGGNSLWALGTRWQSRSMRAHLFSFLHISILANNNNNNNNTETFCFIAFNKG